MTITLAPETETLLRERAAKYGTEPDALANNMLKGLLRMPDENAGTVEKTEEEKVRLWEQAMLDAGLLTRIPPPRDPSTAERPIFQMIGKPLSETIMEERR